MTIDNIFSAVLLILGVYFIIGFRSIGKLAIKQRRKINQLLPFRQSDKDFDGFSILIAQFLCLLAGIIFVLTGLSKLF